MSVYFDPEGLALLFVQQYLSEQGHTTALTALEKSSGIKYDDDKPRRGSELLELVFKHVEQQLATALEAEADVSAADAASHSNIHNRRQLQQQQHAKLREELMLRSAAADYPSLIEHSLGPLPANLLSVLTWPQEDLLLAGAADGSIKLLAFGEGQEHGGKGSCSITEKAQGSNSSSSGSVGGSGSANDGSREVWMTQLEGAGGVLTLAWHPAVASGQLRFTAAQTHPDCLLLAGCMDGSVHVLHAATGHLLASAKPHSKYVVAATWAPKLLSPAQPELQHCEKEQQTRQQLIATASYDSSCCLLRLVGSSSSGSSASSSQEQQQQQQLSLEVVEQVPFSGYVQDVCFLPPGAAGSLPNHDNPSSSLDIDTSSNHSGSSAAAAGGSTAPPAPQQGGNSSLQLVVAVRGTNCLNVLDIQLLRYARQASATCSSAAGADSTDAITGSGSSGSSLLSSPVWRVSVAGVVNMSEAGDSHVSFSAMRLAVSPCDRYLLVATDSPILLVLRLSDWGVVRRVYGLDVDKFHNASIAWHKSSSYILAGASHAVVYVYHLGTAKVVAKLRGHTVNVRAIHYDGSSNRLATCSFDKCVKIYCEP